MNEEIKKDYDTSVSFWDNAYSATEEELSKEFEGADLENDWKTFAPSQKLFDAAAELGNKKKVLDYGCGNGWAGIIAAKSGCKDVSCVDVTDNGVAMAAFYAKAFGLDKVLRAEKVATDWITKVPAETFDGLVCSNVLDVVPTEVSDSIIENLARVAKADATVVIGLNYYAKAVENAERKMTVKEGIYQYVDGVLRLVSRTDEDWTGVFEKYFTVVRLDHFAWAGESRETRRLFVLKKK